MQSSRPATYLSSAYNSTYNTLTFLLTHQSSVHLSRTFYTPVQHTIPVHTTHQSSPYNTPVQYIQHTSPVHTTHQSSTYNTQVQYIQHISPVHTTHQSSTYNTPVLQGHLLHSDSSIQCHLLNSDTFYTVTPSTQ